MEDAVSQEISPEGKKLGSGVGNRRPLGLGRQEMSGASGLENTQFCSSDLLKETENPHFWVQCLGF